MRDAGGKLAERGELLGLNQAVLRGPQVIQRLRQFPRAGLHAFEQSRVLYGQNRLCGEGLQQFDRALGKFAGLFSPDNESADDTLSAEKRHNQQRAKAGADNDIDDVAGSA